MKTLRIIFNIIGGTLGVAVGLYWVLFFIGVSCVTLRMVILWATGV